MTDPGGWQVGGSTYDLLREHDELLVENERLAKLLRLTPSADEVRRLNGELDAMREAERRYGIAMAKVERLQADVLELNGMVAMLNEQLIDWKRRAETAEARLEHARGGDQT
jgi:hypothetical protein